MFAIQACSLMVECPKILKSVCGSNGKTYSDYCEIEIENCKNKISKNYEKIEVAYNGECKPISSLAELEAPCIDCDRLSSKFYSEYISIVSSFYG